MDIVGSTRKSIVASTGNLNNEGTQLLMYFPIPNLIFYRIVYSILFS